MTQDSDNHPELRLLDLHLDRLDEADRRAVLAELARDADLQAKNNRLGRILQPLDHWRTPPTPSHLADRVLSQVAQSRIGSTVSAAASGCVFRPFVRWRELAAIAACLVLLAGAFVPGVAALRQRSQRIACANNLHSVFLGTSAYQQAYAGVLPYAGGVPGASWLPVGVRDAKYVSNSRHSYLLVKFHFGPKVRDFRCPADPDAEAAAEADADRDDFAGARRINYDALNLAGEKPNLRPLPALAYMADANPLFVGARFNETVDPQTANSPAHRGRGQNVLFLNGRVHFMPTPVCQERRDNVWLIEGIHRYVGTETPLSPDDAFLIPGYPADLNR